jgi:8-oxo-dGTP diphosphatase
MRSADSKRTEWISPSFVEENRNFKNMRKTGAVVTSLPVVAAGGIVARASSGQSVWELALVYRSSRSDWGFPKGKLEPGEAELFCARREVEEETGLVCNIGPYVGRTEYTDRRGRPKTVHYWLMDPVSGSFVPSEEVDDMQWVPVDLAKRVLSYQHDRVLLADATERFFCGKELAAEA